MKMIFAIKTTWSVEDSRIKLLRVISCRQNNDAVVGGKTVQFIEKEGAILVGEQRVQIFEDEQAGSCFACFGKYLTDILIILVILGFEALDIEAGLIERIDEGLDGMCLAIAGSANE